jgi:4-hydroxythreonine-4-phosphate dehydrogenase
MMNQCTPIVYGASKVLAFYKKLLNLEVEHVTIQDAKQAKPGQLSVIECWQKEAKIEPGKVAKEAGQYPLQALERAVKDLKEHQVDGLVTAPINKKVIQDSGFKFPGHTEFLADHFGVKDYLMFMVSDELRVGMVVGHKPMKELADAVTGELILSRLETMSYSLLKDFGIEKPKIAVLGLNPHAGESGSIGKEEQEIIIPTLERAKAEDLFVFGPYSADTFFTGTHKNFHGVLAMYHDQGLIPFKSLSFGGGVNYTAGLPIVRTSPDHGTGYDIAGQGKGNPTSFQQAIFSAIDIIRQRADYKEMIKNPLHSAQ